MLTTKKILKEIGCENLDLVRGEGYFYFVYDEFPNREIYDTRSVFVFRLNDLSLESWIYEANILLEKIKNDQIF